MYEWIVLLGFLVCIGGFVAALFVKEKKKLLRAVGVVGICVALVGASFTVVPTGYTGVRTTFGQVSERNVSTGFNLKIPFVQSISLVNNKQQDLQIASQVWGESKEKTPVYASDVIVTYQIAAEKSAWIYTNVSDADRNLISDSMVASAIKSAMVQLDSNTVTVRSSIEPLVKEELTASLNEKYGEDTVGILKVVINNMDFEESYNEAIAAKSIAQQNAEKQKIENETAIAKAEADKTVAVTQAEAEADALKIRAEAEADANKLLNESLTEGVLKAKFYEKWNGELPKAMGSDTVITDISDSVGGQ